MNDTKFVAALRLIWLLLVLADKPQGVLGTDWDLYLHQLGQLLEVEPA